MNSPSDSLTTQPLRLSIQGWVPSFKNRKRVCIDGVPRTEKAVRQRMKEIEAAFLYQLTCAYQIACKTQTGACPLSWIASSVPADDSLKFIRRETMEANLCLPGEEMTVIEIQ